jgi:hypothetical protein
MSGAKFDRGSALSIFGSDRKEDTCICTCHCAWSVCFLLSTISKVC